MSTALKCHIPALPNTKGSPVPQPANPVQLTAAKIPSLCILWDYIFTYHRFFFLLLKMFHFNRCKQTSTLKNIISEEEKQTSFSGMSILLIPSSFFSFSFIPIKAVLLKIFHTTFQSFEISYKITHLGGMWVRCWKSTTH